MSNVIIIFIIYVVRGKSRSFNNNNLNTNNNNEEDQLISNLICFRHYSKNRVNNSYNKNRIVITGRVVDIIYHNDTYYNIVIRFYNYNVNINIMGNINNSNYINHINKGIGCYIINYGLNKLYDINSIFFITNMESFINRNNIELSDSLFEININNIKISNYKYKSLIRRLGTSKCTNNDIIIYNSLRSFLNPSHKAIPLLPSNNNNINYD